MLIHRMIFFHFTNRKLLVKLKTSPTLPSCKHRILKHHSKFTFIGVWPAAGEIFFWDVGVFLQEKHVPGPPQAENFWGMWGVFLQEKHVPECILNVFSA